MPVPARPLANKRAKSLVCMNSSLMKSREPAKAQKPKLKSEKLR
jgi:hypothetical protein